MNETLLDLRRELSDFIKKRRIVLFGTQQKAADYFRLSQPRIARYEDPQVKEKPKLGFLAELVRLYVEKHAEKAQQQELLEVNKFARLYDKGELFKDWNELCNEACKYMEEPPKKPPFVGFPDTPHWIKRPELDNVRRDLSRKECRLLTLYGPGGVGKTWLATEVARWAVNVQPLMFEHGAFFISCASNPSPFNLILAIADRLGISFYEDIENSKKPHKEQHKEQLLSYLREKKMLLVLDSFEYLHSSVNEVCTLITDILANAPTVKILITSQKILGITSEHPYLIDVMRYPKLEDEIPLDDLSDYSAVKLFVKKARQKRHNFSLADEKDGIIRICNLVDGLPLTIVMAAARINTDSCNQIALEIEKNFKYLEVKDKVPSNEHVPPRQLTFQATFEYSWELLSGPEQDVLKRLSVFRGGFTKEAAEQVAEASNDELEALTYTSFIGEQSGRYRILHELLRRSVEEKLDQNSPDKEKVQESHAIYFLAFLKEQGQTITGKPQEILDEIKAEIGNVQIAWNWAVEKGKLAAIDEALDSLYKFYNICSRFEEGAGAFGRAGESLQKFVQQNSTSKSTVAKLLARQGAFLVSLGKYEQAGKLLQDSLEVAGCNEPSKEEVFCLNFLGEIARGKYDDAEKWYGKSREISEKVDDREGMAYALYSWFGWIAEKRGQYDEAKDCFLKSFKLYKEIENQHGMAHSLDRLALNAWYRGDYDEAEDYYGECLKVFKKIGDRLGEAKALGGLGLTKQSTDPKGAEKLIKESLNICQEIGHHSQIAIRYKMLGDVSLELEDYENAKDNLWKALKIFEEEFEKNAYETALCRNRLAEVACGDARNLAVIEDARREYLRKAVETAKNTTEIIITLDFLRVGAMLLVKKGQLLAESQSARQKKLERGVEFLSLVHSHPATWRFYKEKTGSQLKRLEEEKVLPDDVFKKARKRGRDSDLKDLREKVAELWAEMEGELDDDE